MTRRTFSAISLLLFTPYNALASNYTDINKYQFLIDAGSGVSDSVGTRMLTLGVQHDIAGPLKMRATVGGWLDNSGNGRTSSGLVAAQLGYEVETHGVVLSLFTGPSLITTPDSYLGGPFQFTSDAHAGFVQHIGKRSYYLGGFYRHTSSGGIYDPNVGRDVLGLELRF